jgi:hypothetical protein
MGEWRSTPGVFTLLKTAVSAEQMGDAAELTLARYLFRISAAPASAHAH